MRGRHDQAVLNGFTPPATDSFGLLHDEQVLAGAKLVRRGSRFNLDYPLDAFDPPLSLARHLPRHSVFRRHEFNRDDYLDGFYLQASSHIDGLRHQAHPETGFFQGLGEDVLGIERWSRGFAGRGILLDVERHLRGIAKPATEAFPVEILDEVASAEGVAIRRGDILLIRTGWATHYFEELMQEARERLPHDLISGGIAQSESAISWFAARQPSLVAADNAAVEALPAVSNTPFGGLMHPVLIARMGLALGELWALDELAADCAEDGVYEFFVTCKPLNLKDGVGSPASAMAIK
jgi:kynurenine formamidase